MDVKGSAFFVRISYVSCYFVGAQDNCRRAEVEVLTARVWSI